ncbi:MAG: GAF domain-containing protein, partial [Gammaproteobacteria bacterium]|nr:GAF domain-containing protein [Gammaproteobacteria bacterium]
GHVIARGEPVLIDDFAHQSRFELLAPGHGAKSGCVLAVPLSDRGRTIGALSVRSEATGQFGEDELRFLESMSSLLATVLQRAQSEDALSHAQRLESIGQLTGGVAHDFNNLLTVISGNLQVLEEVPACADDPMARQLIASAFRATSRGAELTGKLLAFSRRQMLQPTPVDTGALLRSLTELLRRTLDQRIGIALDADASWCMADAGQLESALLNIAINARDAMPAGGALTFACRAIDRLPDDDGSGLDATDGAGYVAISITDSGCGMPDSVKERAFEPFFTTKEPGRGTGLGLSTVYGFAKQSKGAVNIASVQGQGTTVTLFLPRVEAEAPAEAANDAHGDSASSALLRPGLRVLAVEDDAEVRTVLQTHLAAMDCHVVAVATAEQALDIVASDTPFDLLFTDVALGTGMRGTELAEKTRQLRPTLAVLLTSGFSRELLDPSPAWELLRKPYTRAELMRAAARALASVQ